MKVTNKGKAPRGYIIYGRAVSVAPGEECKPPFEARLHPDLVPDAEYAEAKAKFDADAAADAAEAVLARLSEEAEAIQAKADEAKARAEAALDAATSKKPAKKKASKAGQSE